MVAPTLALVVAVPMQLAAAAGVELAGGYDSTVLNQQTLTYGDGALTRGAVDLQLGHRGETVRQLLRTRGEYYFTSGEGRSFDQGDFVSLTRYALHIEPSDEWLIEGEASYALGQSSLLLGRGGSPFLSFQRGIFGEYTGQLRAQREFSETWRGSLLGGILGRHAVDIPVGLARNNMLTFVSALEVAHDFDDNNVGLAAARGEYFLVDGYVDWVPRIVGYTGLRHFFGEHVTLTVLGGVDSLADQNDVSKFFVGPYANAALSVVLPDEHLTFGLGTRYEYAIIGTTNCAVPVPAGRLCPTNSVIAGGTGRVWGGNFSMLWRPGAGKVSFTGDVTIDYGNSLNADLSPGARPGATREVASVNLSALAGVRFVVGRQLSFFARYNFLYSDIDAVIPGVITEIVRHVGLAGVTFALGSEDDGVTEPLVPYEELEALQDARGAGSNPSGASGALTEDGALTSDPFDLATPDANSTAGEAGSGWLPQPGSDDPNAPVDPDAPPNPNLPRPRNATQPTTHQSTRRSTAPTNHGNAPLAPATAPSGEPAADSAAAPQGESNP